MGVCSFFIVKLRIFVVFQIISAICNAHPHLTADGKLKHPREISSELDTDLEQRFITPIEAKEDNVNQVDDVDQAEPVDTREIPFLSEIKHVKDTFIQPVKMGNIVLLSKVNVEKDAYEKPDSPESSEENPDYLYRKETFSELSKQPAKLRNLADTSVPGKSGDEHEHRSEPDSLADEDIQLRSRDSKPRSLQEKISEADDQPVSSRFEQDNVSDVNEQVSSDELAPRHNSEYDGSSDEHPAFRNHNPDYSGSLEEYPDTRHRLDRVSDVYKQPVKLGNLAILSKLNTMQDDSSLEESESQPESGSLSYEEDEQYNDRFFVRPIIFSKSNNENLEKENDLISNNKDSHKKSHVLVSSRIFTGSQKPVQLKNIALLSNINNKLHELTVEPADEEDDTLNARIPFVQEDTHPDEEDIDASVSVRRIHVYYPPVESDASNSTNQGLSLQARILPDQGSTDPKSVDFLEDKAEADSVNQHEQIALDTRRLSHPLVDAQDVYEQPVQMGNLSLLSKINTKGTHKHHPKSRKSRRKSKQKSRKLKKSEKQKSYGKRNKKHHHKHSHKHAHRKQGEKKSRLTKHTEQKQNNFFAESQNANHEYSLENQDNYFSDNVGSMKQSSLSATHRKNAKTYTSEESRKQQQEQHYFGSKAGQTNQGVFSNAHNTQDSREGSQQYSLSSNLGAIKQDVSSTQYSGEQQQDYFEKDVESMQQQQNSKTHSTQSSREQQQGYSGKYIGKQAFKVHPIHDTSEHHLNYFEGNAGTLKQDVSSDNNLQNSKVFSLQDSREKGQNYLLKNIGNKEKDLSANNFQQNSELNSHDQQKLYFIKDVGSTKHDFSSNNHRQNVKIYNTPDSREQRHHHFGNYAGNTEQNLLASNHRQNCKTCEEQTIFVNNLGNTKQGVLSVSYQQSSKADSALESHEQQKLYFIKDVGSSLSAEDVGHLKLNQASNEHQEDEKFAESNTASEGLQQLKVNSVGDGRRPLMQVGEEAVGKSQAFAKAEILGQGTANAQAQAQAQANTQAQVHAQGQPEALPVLPDKNNKQDNATADSEQHVAEDVLVKDSKQSSDAVTGLASLDRKESQQLKSDLEVSSPKERSRFQHPHMNSEENAYYIVEETKKSAESSDERENRFLPWRRRHHARPQNFIYRPRFQNRHRYHKHGRGRGRPEYWIRQSPSLRLNEENESSQELDSGAKIQDISPDSPVSSRIESNYAEVRRKSDKASDTVSSRMLSPQYHEEGFEKSFAQSSDVRSIGSGDLTANSRDRYQFLSDDSGSKILQAVSPLHTNEPNPMLHFLYSRILPHDWEKVNNLRQDIPVSTLSQNRTVVRQSLEEAPGRVHLHVTNDNTKKVDDKTFSSNMHVDVEGNKEDEGSILSNLKDVLYKIQEFILSAGIESESNNSSRNSSKVNQQDLRLSSSRSSARKNPVRYYRISKKSHGKHRKPVVTTAAATNKLVKSGDKKQSQEVVSDVPLRFLDKHNLARLPGKVSDNSKERDNFETRTLDNENPNNQIYVWPSPNQSELDYIIEDRVATLRQFTYEFNRLVEDLSNFSLTFKSKTDIFGEAVRKSLLDFTNLRDMESIIADAQHLMDHLRRLIQNIINDVGAALQYLLNQPNYAIGEVMQNMSAGLVTFVGQLPRFVTKSIEWTQTRQLRSLQ